MKRIWMLLFLLCLPLLAQNPYQQGRSGYAQNILWRDLHPSTQDSIRNAIADSILALNINKIYDDTTGMKASPGDSAGVRVYMKQLTSGNTKGGGIFIWKTSGYTAKPGVVYAATGGYWVRPEWIENPRVYNVDWIGGDISNAFDVIDDSTTVLIPEGDYTDYVDILQNNIKIVGVGNRKPKITGGFKQINNSVGGLWIENLHLVRTEAIQVGHSTDSTKNLNVTIKDCYVDGNNGTHAILAQGGRNVTVLNCEVTNADHGVALRVSDAVVSNLRSSNTDASTIIVKAASGSGNVRNVMIDNIHVKSGKGIYVEAIDGFIARNVTINNVVSDSGAAYNSRVWTPSAGDIYGVSITGCTAYENTDAAFLNYNGKNVVFVGCIAINGTTGFSTQVVTDTTLMIGCIAYGNGTDISGKFMYSQNIADIIQRGKLTLGYSYNAAADTAYLRNVNQLFIRADDNGLGTSTNDIQRITEIQAKIGGNRLRHQVNAYRTASGSSYSGAVFRTQVGLDSSLMDSLGMYLDMGYRTAFQRDVRIGVGTSFWGANSSNKLMASKDTSATANTGTGGTLPANVEGYLKVILEDADGNLKAIRIPYYKQ